MKTVAKAVIIDKDNRYLMLRRSDHPAFPNDPDLPGGTLEEGELPRQAMLREVVEEVGIALLPEQLQQVYAGDEYAAHHTIYYLFIAKVDARPKVTISWEHSAYEWLEADEFMQQADGAIDTYMHMVHDIMKRQLSYKE